MITVKNTTLRVKRINGPNGPFCIANMSADSDEFKVKESLGSGTRQCLVEARAHIDVVEVHDDGGVVHQHFVSLRGRDGHGFAAQDFGTAASEHDAGTRHGNVGWGLPPHSVPGKAPPSMSRFCAVM